MEPWSAVPSLDPELFEMAFKATFGEIAMVDMFGNEGREGDNDRGFDSFNGGG